jgi:hypothetical protein
MFSRSQPLINLVGDVADDLLGDLPPMAIGALYTSLGKINFDSMTTFDLSKLTDSEPIRPRPDMIPSQFRRLPGLDNTMVYLEQLNQLVRCHRHSWAPPVAGRGSR